MTESIDTFLEESGSLGKNAETGEFTVDLGRALEKLQSFQLGDSSDYLLKVVQAAHQIGSTKIDFKFGVRTTEITFRAEYDPSLSAAELANGLLGQRDFGSQSARHLAVALRSALGTGSSQVGWGFGEEHILTLTGEGATFSWEGSPASQVARFTVKQNSWMDALRVKFHGSAHSKLHNRCRFSERSLYLDTRPVELGWKKVPWRQSWFGSLSLSYVMMESYQAPSADLPCFHFPIVDLEGYQPIQNGLFRNATMQHVNNYIWSKEVTVPSPSLFRKLPKNFEPGSSRTIYGLPCGVAFYLPLVLVGSSSVTFLLDGVCSDPKSIDLGCPGLQILVSGEGLTTDLTEFSVVEDELYRNRVAAIKVALKDFARDLHQNLDQFAPYFAGKAWTNPSGGEFQTQLRDRLSLLS